MEHIDTTDKLEEFYRHLNEADLDRTIFSAKFGDGKTLFLQEFKEKYKNDFDFYTLFPVNYQITPNDAIMEYIKRDLLFQLILNGKITPNMKIPDPILFQWYINEKIGGILQDIISFAPSIVGSDAAFSKVLTVALALKEVIKKQFKKFSDYKAQIEEQDDYNKAIKVIESLSNGKGNIYELDPITYLIANSISDSDKPSVLIIEDLDRIDPAHLFRILNIFSAHIDRSYLASAYTIQKDGEKSNLDEAQNKFGFAKVVFVMDAESTENVFRHFYGETNYKGYISKFLSHRIFYYSIHQFALELLEKHINSECKFKYSLFKEYTKILKIDVDKLSVRDIAKILDNFEKSYRKEEIKISSNFIFWSDTPLVKLLATLLRMGVKENDIISLFNTISEGEVVLDILGCYAINEKSLHNNSIVFFRDKLFQLSFENIKGIMVYQDAYPVRELDINQYKFLEIHIDEIIHKALKYVL